MSFNLQSAVCSRKNIPFHPARNGINFPYFQLARRSFKFPNQLISQCNFSQLAQILYEERLFCRAAPGTPESAVCSLQMSYTARVWLDVKALSINKCRVVSIHKQTEQTRRFPEMSPLSYFSHASNKRACILRYRRRWILFSFLSDTRWI